MLLWFWLLLVFFVGLCVGSLINVAVSRLPLDKSLIWPGSTCGHCLQPIVWHDNIPILGWLKLRGKCRQCGIAYGVRYLFIEIGIGLSFVALFVLEVIFDVHQWPGHEAWRVRHGLFPLASWLGFAHHALLFSFLATASLCDLATREIPLRLTIPGAIIGLVGATLLAWPWPHEPIALAPMPRINAFLPANIPTITEGIYPWPFWLPLPEWASPGGNWQTGLANGLCGMLMGTLMLRSIAWLFGAALGREALGLGDADLMMMAGAFLGWQLVLIGFFFSIVPALVFGIINLFFRNDDSLPFGPSLAAGTMIACLGWRWIGPHLQVVLFWGEGLIGLAVVAVVFLLGAGLLMRRPEEEKPEGGGT